MKKTLIYTSFLALIAFGACSKENVSAPQTEDLRTITVTAGIDNPETKLAYTSDGEEAEGFKLAWEEKDAIELYVGGVNKYVKTNSVKPDGTDPKKAEIDLVVPEGLKEGTKYKWGAYVNQSAGGVAGQSHVQYATSYAAAKLDLSNQAGTAEDTHLYDVNFAGGDDLLVDLADGAISFSPKTTVLKFVLTFPADETGTTFSDIKLSGDNIYKTVSISNGGIGAASVKGDISVADQSISGKKATFYVTLWAGSIKNAKISGKVGEKIYAANVRTAETALAAGKVYTVARNAESQLRNDIIYKTHAAGTYTFVKNLTPSGTWPSSVSYEPSTGVITFAAETEAYNLNTLEFTNGSTVTVTRVDEKDFAGSYTWYSKAFKADGVSNTILEAANKNKTTGISFNAVSTYSEKNGHTPNLEITGLFYDFKLPACVEVDETEGPSFMIYLNNLEYQTCSNSKEYACIPELSNSATGWNKKALAPLNFGPSDCNYFWMPMVIDMSGALKLKFGSTFPYVNPGYCYGLAFVIKGYAAESYVTIYQSNYGQTERNSYFLKNQE